MLAKMIQCRLLRRRGAYVIIAIATLLFILLMSDELISIKKRPLRRKIGTQKVILIYTPFFGHMPWAFAQPLVNYTKRCKCKVQGQCEITYDHDLFDQSELVLFHHRDMPYLEPIHVKRPKKQLWMFCAMENAFYTHSVMELDKYFNLTASYRTHSDIRVQYTWISKPRKYDKPLNITLPNYAKNKTKQIAWAVSNCGQHRDKLARKLHDYGLQIDSFGKCRFPFTNRLSGEPNFQPYKFYFAAESRLCDDYITEKYWRTSLQNNMVPIVFGGGNYSDPLNAIPGSFIDALQFSSPEKLADYLLLLDKNDSLYNEYFTWKRDWTLEDIPRDSSKCTPFVCDLCEKLHSNTWKFRKNPLTSTINTEKECMGHERFFSRWIRSNQNKMIASWRVILVIVLCAFSKNIELF